MRDQAHSLRARRFAIGRPVAQRADAHEDVAAALLAGLDDVALQLVAANFARMDEAALTGQRNKGSNSQFREFLDEELAAIAFGHRGGNFKPKGQLALGPAGAKHLERHRPAGARYHTRGIFAAVAVEEV